MVRVTVVDGEQEYRFDGRVARMIVWLAVQAERIANPDKLEIVFNCAGKRVRTELREVGEA